MHDVLVQINFLLMLEQTSYTVITPFDSNGGLHDNLKPVNVEFTVSSNTSPGTLVYSNNLINFKSIYNSKDACASTHHPAVSPQ